MQTLSLGKRWQTVYEYRTFTLPWISLTAPVFINYVHCRLVAYPTCIAACRTCSSFSMSDCFRESSTSSWRCSARSLPLQPHSLHPRISLPHAACAPQTANAVQVLDWRIPMEAGEYEAYADELFGVAADALLAPPMQVPQILVSWEPPPACERARKLG